jgi:hypothetical protein
VDLEGYLVQIPFDEVKRFRVPLKAAWKLPTVNILQDRIVRRAFGDDEGGDGGDGGDGSDGGVSGGTPDGGSNQTCESTGDSGMMGCGTG